MQTSLAACSSRWKLAYRFLVLRDAQRGHWALTKDRVVREAERDTASRRVADDRDVAAVKRWRAPIDTLGYVVACPSQMELMLIATAEQQLAACRAEHSSAEQRLQEHTHKLEAVQRDEAAARARVASLREGLPPRLQDPMTTIDSAATPAAAPALSRPCRTPR